MKKIFVIILFSNIIVAQNNEAYFFQTGLPLHEKIDSSTTSKDNNQRPNLLKINFPILNQPAFSLHYERNIYKKITAGIALSYTSEREFLFLKLFRQQEINNEFANNELKKIKSRNWSITPEVKYYFGKDAFKGFYFAPFIKYSKYDINFPLDYIEEEISKNYQEVNFTGNSNALTYGFSIGAQWKVSKNFYIDWLIVGPHFGKATEKLRLNSNLSENQQQAISKSLDLIKSELNTIEGYPKINFDYTVNENGGEIRIRNPWGGVRFELGIGYRF